MSNDDKCPVSQIDGNGTPHPCVYLQGHSGEHRYSSIQIRCPATKGECDQPCVGSICNRITRHNAGTCSLSMDCVLAEGHSGVCELLPSVKEDKAINPDYYHGTTVDDFIEEFKLGFRLGSVIKYIARHEHKDKIRDLKKAQWYLAREIKKLEGK